MGYFDDAAAFSPLAEAWDGTQWRVLEVHRPPDSSHAKLGAVSCPTTSSCVAVGDDRDSAGVQVALAESWNGTTWVVQDVPHANPTVQPFLQGVSCTSATSCVAVGYLRSTERGHVDEALAEVWNGSAWAITAVARVPAADSALLGVSCTSADACTAVGNYLNSSSDNWDTLVERWNGKRWVFETSPNAKGSIVDTLYSVSCSAADACTAAGDFIYENGVGHSLGAPLAESWDGSTWAVERTPNPAPSGGIARLDGVSCESSSKCTAVGYVTNDVGEGGMTLAEAWNGSTWAIEPTPDPQPSTDFLFAVSCSSAICFAAGYDNKVSGTPVALTELRMAGKWTSVTTPVPAGTNASGLAAVSCVSSMFCAATGSYDNSTDTERTLAEMWDGTAWRVERSADTAGTTHNVLSGVSCVTSSFCVAVGESYDNLAEGANVLVETWNGESWALQTTPRPPGTTADLGGISCLSASFCVAVGASGNSSMSEPLADIWDGKQWTVTTPPVPDGGYDPELKDVSCTSPSVCTAVGVYTKSASLVTLAERWNGSTWTAQPTPAGVDGYLVSVSCTSATACTGVGNGYSYPSGVATLVEAWNGKVWTVQKTPVISSYFAQLYGVFCRSSMSCTAVGGYDEAPSGRAVPLAEVWDGSAWRIVATPHPSLSSVLAAVSPKSSTTAVAVGGRVDFAGVGLTFAEVERS